MLDGSRYFAEFPEENPDRAPLNPTVLCALVAIEREISRFVVKSESEAGEATDSNVGCDSESRGAGLGPQEPSTISIGDGIVG